MQSPMNIILLDAAGLRFPQLGQTFASEATGALQLEHLAMLNILSLLDDRHMLRPSKNEQVLPKVSPIESCSILPNVRNSGRS